MIIIHDHHPEVQLLVQDAGQIISPSCLSAQKTRTQFAWRRKKKRLLSCSSIFIHCSSHITEFLWWSKLKCPQDKCVKGPCFALGNYSTCTIIIVPGQDDLEYNVLVQYGPQGPLAYARLPGGYVIHGPPPARGAHIMSGTKFVPLGGLFYLISCSESLSLFLRFEMSFDL